MKKILKLVLFLVCSSVYAQTSVPYSVYLVGDAGEDTVTGKALLLLKEELLANPNSAVIFLGDNVYPKGLDPSKPLSVMHLESQLQILKDYRGQVYFIPGNHDWDAQKRKGLKKVTDQEKYVNEYIRSKTVVSTKDASVFLPKNGLPGPETVMLTKDLRLIIIDTQWFLHFFKKNTSGSKKATRVQFYKQLDSLLLIAKNNHEQVIIAAHHPLYSNGQHSRAKQPFRFLVNCTPFQIFGLCGINRLYSQDLPQLRYKKMRKQLLSAIDKYDNITFASGHEHNLQCFKEQGNRYVVSGSGSKRSRLAKRKKFNAFFEDDSTTGFIKIDYSGEGYRSTTIYRVGEKEKVLGGY